MMTFATQGLCIQHYIVCKCLKEENTASWEKDCGEFCRWESGLLLAGHNFQIVSKCY